jgi:calcium-dependent protein kinase
MSGRPPFPGSNEQDRNRNIIANKPDYNKLQGISTLGKDFIKKCLTTDYKERGYIPDMLKHPWIANINEVELRQSVELDIAKNICAFRSADAFQSGVMSLIVGLKASSHELEELKVMFHKLDSNNVGYITLEDLKSGMKNILDPW